MLLVPAALQHHMQSQWEQVALCHPPPPPNGDLSLYCKSPPGAGGLTGG